MTDLRFDERRVPTRLEPQAAIAEIVVGDGGREAVTRTAADDMRVALHESNHAVVGRLLGQPLGGVNINASDDFRSAEDERQRRADWETRRASAVRASA